MYDWIIEADIYRLQKGAEEATDSRLRHELESMAEQKHAALAARSGTGRTGGSDDA